MSRTCQASRPLVVPRGAFVGLLAFAMLILLSPVHGASRFAIYHVDRDNCGATVPDGSPGNPFCTIVDGLTVAQSGDIVVVHKVDGFVNGVPVGPATWGSYVQTGKLTIATGEMLVLEAGVVVKFTPAPQSSTNPGLIVNGALRALGNPGAPGSDSRVYITSAYDDSVGGDANGDGGATSPARGDWLHVQFTSISDDSLCLIENAEIRYGGGSWDCCSWINRPQEAVLMRSASPVIRDTLIRDSLGDAVEGDLDCEPLLQRLTFDNNAVNGYHVLGGTVNGARVWDNVDVVHYIGPDPGGVSPSIHVPQAGRLTLVAGLVVKIAPVPATSDNPRLVVDGVLRIEGTAQSPVILTSFLDDTAQVPDGTSGDTNNDGVLSAPSPGDWYHIQFTPLCNDAQCLIDFAEIRYAGGRWDCCPWFLYREEAIQMLSASPTIRRTVIRDTHGDALECDLDSTPVVEDMFLLNNTLNGMHVLGGQLSQERIWSNTGIVYFLGEDIDGAPASVTITQGTGSLIVKPGVVVKFDRDFNDSQNPGIDVFGSLRLEGTSQAPVILTSIHDDTAQVPDGTFGDTNNNGALTGPARGDWYQVIFEDSSNDETCLVQNAEIRYAGAFWRCCSWTRDKKEGIRLSSASPTIQDTRFFHCWGAAIEMTLDSSPVLARLSAVGVDAQDVSAVELVGTVLGRNDVWTNPGIPYFVSSRIVVPGGRTLDVEAGTIFKLAVADNVGFATESTGVITVRGTARQPVFFTSIRDDAVGGDTNNDSGLTSPAPGDWGQLRFSSQTSGVGALDNELVHAVIRYAGNGTGGSVIPAVIADFARLRVSHSQLTDNVDLALDVTNLSDVQTDNSILLRNGRGIRVSGASRGDVTSCTLHRNGKGLIVDASPARIHNNIIAYSTICGMESSGGTPTDVAFNCFFQPSASDFCNMTSLCGQAGNLCSNPSFRDIFQDDVRLLPGSVCIDVGNNLAIPLDARDLDGDSVTTELVPFDSRDYLRRIDRPGTPDGGQGSAPIVDLGAFEYTDFILTQSDLTRGQSATLEVQGATPGETVFFLYSLAGQGQGPCLPALGGLCLDLILPIQFLASTADGSGRASVTLPIPGSAPLISVSTQAVAARGVGGVDSVKSNPITETIRP